MRESRRMREMRRRDSRRKESRRRESRRMRESRGRERVGGGKRSRCSNVKDIYFYFCISTNIIK